MSPIKNLPCWEIMQCKGTENCPARTRPDIPCWEIAETFGTPENAKDICSECLVYVIKQGDPGLSSREIENIMKRRKICSTEETCPAYRDRKK